MNLNSGGTYRANFFSQLAVTCRDAAVLPLLVRRVKSGIDGGGKDFTLSL